MMQIFALFMMMLSSALASNLRQLGAPVDGTPDEKDSSYTMVFVVCLITAVICAGLGKVWVDCWARKKQTGSFV
ncbi:hypothetical protein TL16_g06335 [Triparma laevis f. inornata]|uniref:Uncharacterized protein n=2 Tax=Triparma laevis TaxID=1534972 RepID=A0A9W7E0D4_9STRA|nr:hypothetical protein TrLO_g6133 [Triparma laevis f. longispina]GMH73971.1 hypothetical protein TL16_g06335 [Triparma laevis f. inornata]